MSGQANRQCRERLGAFLLIDPDSFSEDNHVRAGHA